MSKFNGFTISKSTETYISVTIPNSHLLNSSHRQVDFVYLVNDHGTELLINVGNGSQFSIQKDGAFPDDSLLFGVAYLYARLKYPEDYEGIA